MPKVDLTATKDFTYMTRRLTAGDPFQARNPLEARILTRVRKVAEAPSGFSISDGSTILQDIAAADASLRDPNDPLSRSAPKPKAPAKKAAPKAGAKARKRKAAAKK
jgi:hypothetical protein